ncbi:MAG TPA: hypothetical protein VN018_02530 [Brevundimonas sp.]|nr:hypothetical protein [Brevundimonas sp.]
MATDILLGDAEVTIHRADSPPNSTALNLRNPSGYWHISGPRTYEPGNPLAVYWNDNSNWIGPMLTVQTGGNIGIGASEPASTLHVHGGEVHSTGPVAGFSFTTRDLPDGKTTGNDWGERWVWYATGNSARLWSDADLVTVTAIIGNQARMAVKGTVECTFLKLNGKQVGAELANLRKEIDALKAEIAKLKG